MNDKMKGLLVGLAIFVIGSSIVAGAIVIADGEGRGSPAAPVAASSMPMAAPTAATAPVAAASTTPATTKVAIMHVQQGCHVFKIGDVETPTLTLQMHRGQMLDLTNMDVDMQRMMQVSGPRMMMQGAAMRMGNGHMTMTFDKAGAYRFSFDQPPMPGAADDEESDGANPDNTLTLNVNAA
jgi:hypothetical protein